MPAEQARWSANSCPDRDWRSRVRIASQRRSMLRDVTERYTPLTPETLTSAQKPIYDAIAAARHGSVPQPFHVFLQAPELADRTQQLGALLRYRTGLPARL